MKNLYNIIIALFLSVNSGSILAKQPNLIVIHTDEHSFRTIGAHRALLPSEQAFVWGKDNAPKTPNIDSLANQGGIAINYYASAPVCTPSRASIVTGRYSQSTGAPTNGKHLSESIPTWASILKQQGYLTAYVGKWHLAGNGDYSFNIKYKAGFSDNRWMMTGGHAPYFQVTGDKVKSINVGKSKKFKAGELIHATDFFTDKAIEIMKRDKQQPFAIMLSIPDPHTPDFAHPPYDKMYAEMDLQRPKSMQDKLALSNRPRWGYGGKNEAKEFDPEALKQYFGMVSHIDDNVGKILSFLQENDLVNNTIVVFTSDHGEMFFEHNRRNKSVPYEAAAKIPFLIRYPAKIPSGKVLKTVQNNVDFAPTILGLMAIKTDVKFDGADLSPAYTNQEKVISDPRMVYYANNGLGKSWVAGVNQKYKLILDPKVEPWLFDLQKDPDESKNVYFDPSYQAIAKQMKQSLLKLLEQTGEKNIQRLKH